MPSGRGKRELRRHTVRLLLATTYDSRSWPGSRRGLDRQEDQINPMQLGVDRHLIPFDVSVLGDGENRLCEAEGIQGLEVGAVGEPADPVVPAIGGLGAEFGPTSIGFSKRWTFSWYRRQTDSNACEPTVTTSAMLMIFRRSSRAPESSHGRGRLVKRLSRCLCEHALDGAMMGHGSAACDNV